MKVFAQLIVDVGCACLWFVGLSLSIGGLLMAGLGAFVFWKYIILSVASIF